MPGSSNQRATLYNPPAYPLCLDSRFGNLTRTLVPGS